VVGVGFALEANEGLLLGLQLALLLLAQLLL
jgi:hypothetical protein